MGRWGRKALDIVHKALKTCNCTLTEAMSGKKQDVADKEDFHSKAERIGNKEPWNKLANKQERYKPYNSHTSEGFIQAKTSEGFIQAKASQLYKRRLPELRPRPASNCGSINIFVDGLLQSDRAEMTTAMCRCAVLLTLSIHDTSASARE